MVALDTSISGKMTWRTPFQQWAVFAPKDQTGFGRMADDMLDVLGFRYRFIADSHHMTSALPEGPYEHGIPQSATTETSEHLLNKLPDLRGVVCFERLDWNLHFLRACRRRGIKVVCVPMWEWFACNAAQKTTWQEIVDLFVCPNRMCEKTLRYYGIKNLVTLPWCLDLSKLPLRKIEGPGRLFFHNAGLVDGQDRKGTWDVIQAFAKNRRDDIRLIIRMQREKALPPLDQRMELRVENLTNPGDLYSEGEVAIQPSKMEGIGFMVLEPVACGIPTITLDYPPMNEAVRHPELLVKKQWFKRRAIPSVWVKHAHLRLPSITDLAARIEACASTDLGHFSRENRLWAEREFDRAALTARWAEAVL